MAGLVQAALLVEWDADLIDVARAASVSSPVLGTCSAGRSALPSATVDEAAPARLERRCRRRFVVEQRHDPGFVPFAQLSLALCGAAALGIALARARPLRRRGRRRSSCSPSCTATRPPVLRLWVDWNYSGLEAKELWPAWRALNDRLRGGTGDPRVAVEYDPVHERAGSIRMYEMLPFFSGRSTLEGVYNQASTVTHPVYYLASELFARSPNPFRSRSYSRFDPQSALARVRLFDVGTIVATSQELTTALDARSDVVREARIAPYTLYRLRDPGPGYVEPLQFEPVRAPLRGWRDQCYRWFTRKPANRALLVFSDDPRFTLVQPDPWLPPPERPLPAPVHVKETVEAESIRIETDRPGHPLLVKVSYHPRWRVEGGAGPYLVSPGLMLVVPSARVLRLRYAARDASDWTGIALALAAALATVAGLRRRPRGAGLAGPEVEGRGPGPADAALRLAPRALPVVAVIGLAALRLVPQPSHDREATRLYERASRAYAAQQWLAAAELARHGSVLVPPTDPRRHELLCVQGESLLAAGQPREAALAFQAVVDEGGPHRPQALFSGARARELAGDPAGAAAWRRQLAEHYAGTPWAERLGTQREGPGAR